MPTMEDIGQPHTSKEAASHRRSKVT